GDGRIVRTAVKHYEVKGVGIDINPLLIYWAKILGKNKAQFKVENIFDTDLKQADYVYIFLMPKLIEKLTLKMNKELKKGTIVISHAFPVKGWEIKLFKTLKRVPFPTYYYKIK
ncbi:MAG: SAM-dependent methyltransferase, partial [Candidatus Roizmanbacteria bacterium]